MIKSLATTNEKEPKHSNYRERDKGKELHTSGRPQVGRDLQGDPFASTANP